MKKIIKYMMVVLLTGGVFNSCETTDLDLRVSPNDLAADQADPNLLLNSVQFAYIQNIGGFNGLGESVTRIQYMGGRDYFNNFPGATFNGIWSRTYSSQGVGMLTNISNLEQLNEESGVGSYNFHVGISKAMMAHNLMLLVDYLGEAAWSQANNPDEFPAPMLDSGQEIYTTAFGLLDEAEALLSGDPSTQGAEDFFYGGDASKWSKFINTVRLKAYVTTNDVAAFNAIIAGDNFISDSADDFQFQFGTRELDPDTRHPNYSADYTPSGANIYQSNWLMEKMLDLNDPRIRYYFFRQVGETPGADADPSEETLACSLVVPPQHYIDGGYTYCSVEEGYWGRSHGNDEGTPPDNFLRAAVGVYPSGGKLDADLFRNGSIVFDEDEGEYVFEYDTGDNGVGLGLGAGGAGITPIFLASYVDFWRADMATSAAEKATFLRSALEKSIAKVTSAISDPTYNPGALLDDTVFDAATGEVTTAVLASSLFPSDADITAYIDGVVADFIAASGDDQENILAEQYWIALYGGGAESFNYYRKTGFPTTLLPNWELNPGPFPRSFLYPQDEVVTNPNLTQKTTLTEQVFWDTNPAGPAFPPAN